MDGRKVSTDSPDPGEAFQARGYEDMTHGGRVGSRFKSLSDAAVEQIQSGKGPPNAAAGHVREVIERQEEQGRVLVRVRIAGLE